MEMKINKCDMCKKELTDDNYAKISPAKISLCIFCGHGEIDINIGNLKSGEPIKDLCINCLIKFLVIFKKQDDKRDENGRFKKTKGANKCLKKCG